VHEGIKARAFEAGLICYPMGGTIDGKHGNHLLLAPPFIMDDGHIDLMIGALRAALGRSALPGAPRAAAAPL